MDAVEPGWCLVANMGADAFGPAPQCAGTRHFSPGTKLWLAPPGWGDGYERVPAVGRHRGGRKLVSMVVRADRLTNWRAELVYSPAVLRRLSRPWDRAEAERYAQWLRQRHPDQPDVRAVGSRVTRALRALASDPRGAELLAEAAATVAAGHVPPAVQVLGDWLAERDAALPPARLLKLILTASR